MVQLQSDPYRLAAESLWETVRMINANASLDEILDYIVTQADAINGAHFVTISMLKGPDGPIQIHSYRGEFPEEMRNVEVEIGEATVGRAIKERRTIAIEDVDRVQYAPSKNEIDEDHQVYISGAKRSVLEKAAENFKAVLAIPLMTSRRIFGALVYYYTVPHKFSREEIQLASSFAEQASLAIENARSYQEQIERRRELGLLLELAAAASSTLEMEEMITVTLDRLVELVGASRAGVILTDEVTGDLAEQILRPEREVASGDMEKMLAACRSVIASGVPLYTDPHPEQGLLEPGALLPLITREQTHGILGIIGAEGTIFSRENRELFETIADQLAIAVDNAHLFQETGRRRQVAEGLQDILSVLNRGEPLEVTLTFIIQKALELTGADAGVIYHYGADKYLLSVEAGVNLPPEFEELQSIPAYSGGAFKAMFDRTPYVLEKIGTHLQRALESPEAKTWHTKMKTWLKVIAANYDAYLGIPLFIQGKIYGSLGLYFNQARQFQGEEIELAVAFGGQAALSIENAQLSLQAGQIAVQAERNRLARDLHDAVTQTLFSASLVADVLPKLWEMDPESARQKLEDLRKLTRGALSEMRTMLMELRPSALVEADIEDLFQHLINAFIARTMVDVRFEKQGDENPPLAVKEVLYRIVQEALNNIEKHACAEQVEIVLLREEDHFELTISDNGCGFDPAQVPQDHLGLGIMAERARGIGADFEMKSAPGEGARVFVCWRNETEEVK